MTPQSTDPLEGFDEFMRREAIVEPPVIAQFRVVPPSAQRIVIARLHLPFGDVFRFALQTTAASLVIGFSLWLVVILLMMLFGVGIVGINWLAR